VFFFVVVKVYIAVLFSTILLQEITFINHVFCVLYNYLHAKMMRAV